MTTVSDVFVAAKVAAEQSGSHPTVVDNSGGVRTRGRDARTRARLPVTHRVRTDLTQAWVWRDTPPSLRGLIEARLPDPDRVPSGSAFLRAVWVLWNFGVAVPTSTVLYLAAWVLQHPARAVLTAGVITPIILMWIK